MKLFILTVVVAMISVATASEENFWSLSPQERQWRATHYTHTNILKALNETQAHLESTIHEALAQHTITLRNFINHVVSHVVSEKLQILLDKQLEFTGYVKYNNEKVSENLLQEIESKMDRLESNIRQGCVRNRIDNPIDAKTFADLNEWTFEDDLIGEIQRKLSDINEK